MRPVQLVLLGILLAGCSSPTPETDPVVTTTSTTTSSAPIVSTRPQFTDTMHLLDAPHTAATLSTSSEVRTPVPSASEAFTAALVSAASGQPAPVGVEWQFPRQDLRVLEGNATIWVEIQGTITYPTENNGCFWSIHLRAEDANGNGYGSYSNCIPEGSVVQPGIRALNLTFEAFDVSEITGEHLSIAVSTRGVYAPGASIHVLSGSQEHDSRISLRGLALPLDTQTLVLTT